MATVREKRPGVWEVRVFTGTDALGRPTQLSRTIRGGKRDAQRLAAELEVGPGSASPVGRSVADVLDAWVDQNLDTWAPSSERDQQSRVRSIKKDLTAQLPVGRLSVADVERWHTRLRAAGMQDAGIRNQHGVLRAALSQAQRWGWVSTNVASMARRKSRESQPRGVMSVDDGMLTIDSAIEVIRHPGEPREFRDAPTKTANTRRLTLDPTHSTRFGRCAANVSSTANGCSASDRIWSHPITSDGGGGEHARCPVSTRSGVFTISATGRPPSRSAKATMCVRSPAASGTRTRR